MDKSYLSMSLLILPILFPYIISSFSKCRDYHTIYDCYVNNCNWENLNDTCISLNKQQNYTINVSLPQHIPLNYGVEETNPFPNCTVLDMGEHHSATDIKCSWKIKSINNDKCLSVKLTQRERGNYILGFSAKYLNGTKKNYWFTETNSSKTNKIEIGMDIDEVVLELMVINDQWKHEIFTVEIEAWQGILSERGDTHEKVIIVILIIFNAFFIFFIAIVLLNTIQKYCCINRSNRSLYFNKHFWKKAKKNEVLSFCKKRMPVSSLNEIIELDEKKIYGNACSICLEDFNENEKLCKIECNHIFHRSCIQNWMLEKYINPYCPNCHSVIFNNDLYHNNTSDFGRITQDHWAWEDDDYA